MTDRGTPVGPKDLSLEARALYGRITRGEPARPSDSVALAELREWRLVAEDPDHPGVPVALDPRDIAQRQLMAEARYLALRATRMAGIPDMADELALHWERAKGAAGAACEFLSDPATVNARIQVAVARAESEICAAQPGGPRTRDLLDMAVERDSLALERGVTMRTLYLDTVRDDDVTREWATVMTGKGYQFRTLGSPFQRCIVIDGREAFIEDYTDPDAPAHAAWHVRDRALVGFIAATFHETWRRAAPWTGQARTAGLGIGVGSGPRTTRRQRELLRDLCDGISQESTAKRLGWSHRAVVREFAKLRSLFGARSQGQLAFEWALSPERLIDDEPVIARGDVQTAA